MTQRVTRNLGAVLGLLLGLLNVRAQEAFLDQILVPTDFDVTASVTPNVSQIFTDFPTFNSLVLDDFEVTGMDLTIRSVQALFVAQSGFESFDSVSGYRLSLFDDPMLAASSLVGNIASVSIPSSSGDFSLEQVGVSDLGLVTLTGEWTVPAVGTYWVGVAPEAPFSVAGQFSVANGGASGVDGGSNGFFANPSNGFGNGTFQSLPTDFAFLVSSEVIPEPSAGLLVLIGALVGVVRRRRM